MTQWIDPLVDDEEPDLPIAALMAAGPAAVPDFLADLFARPAWHTEAACRGQGTAAFFPERGQSTEPARRLCTACPVIVECAEAGASDESGIWGGTSGRGRKTLRRDGATLTEDQLRANADPGPPKPPPRPPAPLNLDEPPAPCPMCGEDVYQPLTGGPQKVYCSRTCQTRARRTVAA